MPLAAENGRRNSYWRADRADRTAGMLHSRQGNLSRHAEGREPLFRCTVSRKPLFHRTVSREPQFRCTVGRKPPLRRTVGKKPLFCRTEGRKPLFRCTEGRKNTVLAGERGPTAIAPPPRPRRGSTKGGITIPTKGERISLEAPDYRGKFWRVILRRSRGLLEHLRRDKERCKRLRSSRWTGRRRRRGAGTVVGWGSRRASPCWARRHRRRNRAVCRHPVTGKTGGRTQHRKSLLVRRRRKS